MAAARKLVEDVESELRDLDQARMQIDQKRLESIYRIEPMSELPELADDIVNGRITGRVVIDVNQ